MTVSALTVGEGTAHQEHRQSTCRSLLHLHFQKAEEGENPRQYLPVHWSHLHNGQWVVSLNGLRDAR